MIKEPFSHNKDLDNTSDKNVVSKSRRKRESLEVQKLGENLLQLDLNSLKTISLPDNLLKALDEARQIKKHGALKRQLQYIGKLMRKIDVEPIRQEYNKIINHYGKNIKQLHYIEKWRDRLLAEGDKALNDLLNDTPNADHQHLRQLLRKAKKEKEQQKPLTAAREIFQYLKSIFDTG